MRAARAERAGIRQKRERQAERERRGGWVLPAFDGICLLYMKFGWPDAQELPAKTALHFLHHRSSSPPSAMMPAASLVLLLARFACGRSVPSANPTR